MFSLNITNFPKFFNMKYIWVNMFVIYPILRMENWWRYSSTNNQTYNQPNNQPTNQTNKQTNETTNQTTNNQSNNKHTHIHTKTRFYNMYVVLRKLVYSENTQWEHLIHASVVALCAQCAVFQQSISVNEIRIRH